MGHRAITKTYSGCRKCPFVKTCNHKYKELHGYINSAAENAAMPAAMSALRDTSMVTINIGGGMSVNVYREDMKKEIEKRLRIGLEYGA